MVLRGCLATREYIQLACSVARAERGHLPTTSAAYRVTPPIIQNRPRSYATASRRPPPDYLPAVWTFSPINTGNPFYDEPLSSSPVVEPELVSAPLKYPAYDPLAPWPAAPFSTSLCNTGNPILDHFFNTVESSNTATTMSDADYEAFLNKASADAAASAPAHNQSSAPKTTTINTSSVHPALKSVKATYTSETDAAFEPVSLSLPSTSTSNANSGRSAKLSEEDFASIAGTNGKDFEVMDVQSFDPHDRFKEVVKAVEAAAGAKRQDVSVFRAEKGGARCEYWILAVREEKEGRIAVGLKVDAVES